MSPNATIISNVIPGSAVSSSVTSGYSVTSNFTPGTSVTSDLQVGAVGPQGVQGPQGPAGPPGPSGTGDKNYTQAFASASTVVVTHNLGKYPAMTVLDSAGDECEGEVVHNSLNQLTVTFSAAFSGNITCN